MNQFPLKDGDHEIIHSSTCNIYDDNLTIKNVAGYNLLLIFNTNIEDKKTSITMKIDNENKEVKINLDNFGGPLGTGTTKRIPILTNNETNEEISISIYAKTLNESTSFRQVTITIYKK